MLGFVLINTEKDSDYDIWVVPDITKSISIRKLKTIQYSYRTDPKCNTGISRLMNDLKKGSKKKIREVHSTMAMIFRFTY